MWAGPKIRSGSATKKEGVFKWKTQEDGPIGVEDGLPRVNNPSSRVGPRSSHPPDLTHLVDKGEALADPQFEPSAFEEGKEREDETVIVGDRDMDEAMLAVEEDGSTAGLTSK